MNSHTPLRILSLILIILLSSLFFSFAQEEENLSELQRQARFYRARGLEHQSTGDKTTAMAFYQKAIQIDPNYAAAYNDLGVIYESNADIQRAEACYLKALALDSYHLSAYTNLAFLSESKRDFKKAAYYWRKRIEYGLAGEEWTEKARKRLRDIESVMPSPAFKDKDITESEIVDLTKSILQQKALIKEDDKALSRKFLDKAMLSYNNEDYATAIKAAVDAYQLDPSNKKIEELISKIHKRSLTR